MKNYAEDPIYGTAASECLGRRESDRVWYRSATVIAVITWIRLDKNI
jgi:hypothetical protein